MKEHLFSEGTEEPVCPFGHHLPLFAQSLGVQCRHVESMRTFLFVMPLLWPSKISFERFNMYCPL